MNPLASTSPVPDLLTGAIDSSRTLQKTIQSFLNNDRASHDFIFAIEKLMQALESLENVATDEGPVISMLKLPLLCCHRTCQEFNAAITKRSKASRCDLQTCLRDWPRIREMGGDIRDFEEMLKRYVHTIAITRERLKMQKAPAAGNAMDRYKAMIEKVTPWLKVHSTGIDQKVAVAEYNFGRDPNPAASEGLELLREERQSARQCLLICEDAASSLHTPLQDSSPPPNSQSEEDSRGETATAVDDARDKVAHMLTELQKQLVDLTERSLTTDTSDQPHPVEEDRLRLLKLIDMAKLCLDACNLAAAQASRQRVHVLDSIVAEENSHQVIVFPPGDLVHVRNVRAGKSSTQWLGCLTEASLQQLSAAHAASFS